MSIPGWVWLRIYHGTRGSVVAMGTAITALGHWPTRYEWLVIVFGGLGGFYLGIDSYRKEPK